MATVLHGAGVGLLGRLELLQRLLHAAVHVRPVIAIADRGVETDQLLPVLGHLARESGHPIQRGVAIDHDSS
jgi:hypothetical protein